MTSPAGVFRRSSRCTKGGRLELAPLSDGGVVIRSTLRPDQSLTLGVGEWADFLAAARAGELG